MDIQNKLFSLQIMIIILLHKIKLSEHLKIE